MIRTALTAWRIAGAFLLIASAFLAADLLSPRERFTATNGEVLIGHHTLQQPLEIAVAVAVLVVALALLLTIVALTNAALHRAER